MRRLPAALLVLALAGTGLRLTWSNPSPPGGLLLGLAAFLALTWPWLTRNAPAEAPPA